MSFGLTAATWLAIGVGTTAATTIYSADRTRKATNQAAGAAERNALKTQQAADVATNRANARSPDTAAMMSANLLAGKAGQASTMLTGPQGIDPTQLTLGKNSLLGG